eukprot:CAMPEP_0202446802 /NCGR_PEP_ID=MMETSP1360-20130828/5386_1 /ASSEMBLY_ACC=CAM_ASM_000848 /TAXON_ID=515479 /ORGANISM="Licmophora paradoxa, Strain CCMP2313" /LENGTH=94 /DNA_ID=CAMNT_0049063507 /DNA_START=398 /DNA_END=682 /DNA_ORIENTATION=+
MAFMVGLISMCCLFAGGGCSMVLGEVGHFLEMCVDFVVAVSAVVVSWSGRDDRECLEVFGDIVWFGGCGGGKAGSFATGGKGGSVGGVKVTRYK